MHLIKDFWGSLLVAVIGIVVAGWWGANGPLGLWVAVWLVVVLSVLEVSLSFDNAVVNAGVLKDMNQFWRTMFLTVGILIAVFGMRLVFPVVIVAVSADMSAVETMRMALSDPDRYAETLNRAYPSISAFGGAFLLLVFLKFIFDHEKEKTLSVYFTDATNSTYHGVPKELYQGLLKAKSAGGFFNDKIRDHYKSS